MTAMNPIGPSRRGNVSRKAVAKTTAPTAATVRTFSYESEVETLDQLFSLPPSEFVRAAYHVILGRECDPGGERHYVGRMASGETRREVLKDVWASGEHLRLLRFEDEGDFSDEQFVTAVYQRLLGRAADPAGLKHYVARLKQGLPRSKVIKDIGRSPEARDRGSAAPLRRQVRQIAKAGPLPRSLFERPSKVDRQLARVDFLVSTSVARLEQRLTDVEARLVNAMTSPSEFRSSAENFGPSRRRWRPRKHLANADAAPATGTPHPDFLRVTQEMEREGRFGELANAASGRGGIDDYLRGAWPPEKQKRGPVRWIGKTASAHLRVTGRTLHIIAAGVFKSRAVYVSLNGVMLGRGEFGVGATTVKFPVDQWRDRDVVLQLRCVGVHNPARSGSSPDRRDLGLQVHSIYIA
jgi:hypothetical protein